jgi:DNA-binding NarL/FixJ family response regulator
MLIHVAVADPLVPYADGMTAMLHRLGVSAEVPEDLESWAVDPQWKVVFLTLVSERDWEQLGRLRTVNDQLLVVAVMDRPDQAACARAVAAGAVSILHRGAPLDAVIGVIHSLARGESVVPLAQVGGLAALLPAASGAPEGDARTTVSPQERDWLRQLARGATVRQLASNAGYSERMMFRLLRSLYTRLDVTTRTEALFLAREHGWI